MNSHDVEELTLFWTAAQRTVSAFLRTLITDSHQSDDILQRVALVVVRKFPQYDRSRPFTAWAIGIAKQEVLLHRRKYKTDRHLFDDAMIDRIALTYENSLSDGLSDLRDALQKCVEKLQGRARQAIDLHYSEDLKSSQIAEQLGLADGAVRMLLSRTRNTLRACVEQQLGRSLQKS